PYKWPVLPPHPDRLAETLALIPRLRERAGPGPFAGPGAGSADARIDLKLLLWRTLGALHARGTRAAHARFAALDGEHLLAGTGRGGVGGGARVAGGGAISWGEPQGEGGPPSPQERLPERELRKTRDVAVASGSARVRWTRKAGILLVDRERGVHAERCIAFE